MNILIPCSIGELYDKITILEIKLANITDERKLKNIKTEYDSLNSVLEYIINKYYIIFEEDSKLYNDLKKVNEEIWSIEDKIRERERDNQFDHDFIDIARSVYKTNDRRANLKYLINQKHNSSIIEEKSYEKY